MIHHPAAKALVIVLSLFAWVGVHAVPISAADKAYHWDSIEVGLSIQPNGDLRVQETQTYRFTEGSFTRGYRDIRLDRLEGIVDPDVREGDRAYRRGSEQPGTYATSTSNGDYRIEWWFDPTERAARTFTIAYTVRGIIRRYEGGDQLWWKAIGKDRGQPVERSAVTVRLPAQISPGDLKLGSYGAPTDGGRILDDRTVRFVGGRVGASEELEIRVQFPHRLVGGDAPAWQAEADREAAYNERVRPVVNVASLAISLLLLAGGLVGVTARWFARGRDPDVGSVPRILDEPPGDLPPGLVGALLDEQVQIRDILAALLDLARRGHLTIEETPSSGGFLGMGKSKRDFRLTRRPGPEVERSLRPHERMLLRSLFGSAQSVELSDLRNTFHERLPSLREAMYGEMVSAGLAPEDPQRVRRRYITLGIALTIGGFFVGVFVWGVLQPWTDAGGLPFLALAVVGAALSVLGFSMPRRTRLGAEQAARWRAFREHLARVARGGDERISGQLFERYLQYAVAFGLQDSWLAELDRVVQRDTNWTPTWYASTRPDDFGATSNGGPRSSDGGALASSPPSLQHLSDGLAGLLNDAGTALTSSPSSSSGGWSGGGGGGGSGGGGGGAS